jgi:hypothetical protein
MSPLNFDCCINVNNEDELFAQIRELMCDLRPSWNPTELKFNVSGVEKFIEIDFRSTRTVSQIPFYQLREIKTITN